MENQEVQAETADPVTELTAVQKDLERINTAIDQLKAASEDLFADEIATLEARAQVIATKIEEETNELTTEIKAIEQTFVQKYGQAAAHAVEILLLAVIAGKLLGAM